MKKILVVAGASGVGKTTVVTKLLSDYPDFSLVRSVTTRAPRGDAHDGEYIYTDRTGFEKLIEGGEVLEYMEYGDNLYGTPISELSRIFSEGKIPTLILDIEGVKSLRRKKFDFLPVIFYLYDDIETVEKRLYSRFLAEGLTEEKMLSFNKRMEANRRDYALLPEIKNLFDAVVKNVGIAETADELVKLFEKK